MKKKSLEEIEADIDEKHRRLAVDTQATLTSLRKQADDSKKKQRKCSDCGKISSGKHVAGYQCKSCKDEAEQAIARSIMDHMFAPLYAEAYHKNQARQKKRKATLEAPTDPSKPRRSLGARYCLACHGKVHISGWDFHECYPLGSPQDLVAETHEDYKRCKERIYARLTRLTLFGTTRDLAVFIERQGLQNYVEGWA